MTYPFPTSSTSQNVLQRVTLLCNWDTTAICHKAWSSHHTNLGGLGFWQLTSRKRDFKPSPVHQILTTTNNPWKPIHPNQIDHMQLYASTSTLLLQDTENVSWNSDRPRVLESTRFTGITSGWALRTLAIWTKRQVKQLAGASIKQYDNKGVGADQHVKQVNTS